MDNIPLVLRRVSPYSWVVAIILDLIWGLFEGISGASLVGWVLIPILAVVIFIVCFTSVTFIQLLASRDSWSAAMGKGVLLGVAAAVPFPVTLFILAGLAAILRSQTDLDGETIQLGQLTKTWRRLEHLLERQIPYETRLQGNVDMIDYLHNNGTISSEEREELHELRRLRNAAVHSNSPSDMTELVNRLRAITTRLSWRMR